MNAPRCGKLMHRFEKPGEPILDDPECGRPAGHNGECKSVQALKRARPRDQERQRRWRRAQRSRRLHADLAAVIAAAEQAARFQARSASWPLERRAA